MHVGGCTRVCMCVCVCACGWCTCVPIFTPPEMLNGRRGLEKDAGVAIVTGEAVPQGK